MGKPTYNKVFASMMKTHPFQDLLRTYQDAIARSGIVSMRFDSSTREEGKVVDPVFTYRLTNNDHSVRVVNAENAEGVTERRHLFPSYCLSAETFTNHARLMTHIEYQWSEVKHYDFSRDRFSNGGWGNGDSFERRVIKWLEEASKDVVEEARARARATIDKMMADPGFPALERRAAVELARNEIAKALKRFEHLGDGVLREAVDGFVVGTVLNS